MMNRKGTTKSEADITTREISVYPGKEIHELKGFKNNKISTSKYSIISFLPKNLMEQFSRLANVYFLIIAIMQTIPPISISDGQPVILVPLLFVLTISAIKAAIEDYKRHISDAEENRKKTYVCKDGRFVAEEWQNLLVGQIVKVYEDEYFPADIFLLNSSESNGGCYVETKNLDGETNLKTKTGIKEVQKEFNTESDTNKLSVKIACEGPSDRLYEYNGRLRLENMYYGLAADQLLLRGTSLRNTKFAFGIVIYTGHETKIMLNSTSAKAKSSRVEKTMNRQIIYIFVMQMILCFSAGIVYASWSSADRDKTDSYLDWDNDNPLDSNFLTMVLVNFGTWILIFTNFVPISLIVTLEVVKFCQAWFITQDEEIFDEENNLATKVQSSNLNEELGQIHYVFSDKTGTLTKNEMEFKKMSVRGVKYGDNDLVSSRAHEETHGTATNITSVKLSTDKSRGTRAKAQGIPNVDFDDQHFFDVLYDDKHPNHDAAYNMIQVLALCHTALVEKKDGEMKYQVSSPDELALINLARFSRVIYQGCDDDGNMKLGWFDGSERTYELLNVLEFTSTRKRMSVIIRFPNGRIKLLCKGADNVIAERLENPKADLVITTENHLMDFARDGLRTLLIAERELSVKEYEEWNSDFQEAYQDIHHRKERCEIVAEKIECKLQLIGATAIEDKLQDHVGETIKGLKEAGIQVWVLTGDKIETAINIGFACQLLTPDVRRVVIDAHRKSLVSDQLEKANNEITAEMGAALIIAGSSLNYALRPDFRAALLELSDKCSVVLACRVSPKQKAEVVRLVKEGKPGATTLAIGDGANDVNMITAAHIGIGISGKEGQQAVRASDYAIGQFSFLKKLLFVHGREAYRRNSILVCYNFYKNVVFVIPHLWFAFVSMFSGQPLYDPWIYQLYNVFFTSLPIVLYAIFDRDREDLSELNYDPVAYRPGMEEALFNTRVFWKWVLYAVFQGCYVLFVSFEGTDNGKGDDGHLLGLWVQGSTVYTAVVLVVTWKLLHFSSSHYWFTAIAAGGSIVVYFICEAILSSIKYTELWGSFKPKMSDLRGWFAYTLILGFSTVLDMSLWSETETSPLRDEDFQHRLLSLHPKAGGFVNGKVFNDKHTGYDYSNDFGTSPIFTEKQKSLGGKKKRFHTGFSYEGEKENDLSYVHSNSML